MKWNETARRIRQILDLRGMRAQDLSERSGVSKASISQYINGKNKPSRKSAEALAEVLDVDPLWLMGYDVTKERKRGLKALPFKFKIIDATEKCLEMLGWSLDYVGCDVDEQDEIRGIKTTACTMNGVRRECANCEMRGVSAVLSNKTMSFTIPTERISAFEDELYDFCVKKVDNMIETSQKEALDEMKRRDD